MMKVKLRQVKYLINLEAFFPSLMAQTVKHLPAVQEIRVQALGWGDPLEKKMATHFSILAWKISWRGAWWAAVHGDTKSQAGLSD